MWNFFLRYTLHSDFVIYTCRTLFGFSLGYILYKSFPEYSVSWALISIILVISPIEDDSKKIAIDRTKANLIGSFVGLSLFFTQLPLYIMLVLGIFSTILICRIFNILAVARTAMVAIIIVLVHEKESKSFLAAIDRFACVTVGCIIGLLVTVISAYFIKKLRLKYHV